jgi:hypothetical protein
MHERTTLWRGRALASALCGILTIASSGACDGVIGDATARQDSPVPAPGTDGGRPPVTLECGTTAVGATPMRRLTNQQYANVMRDLFAPLAVDPEIESFATDTKIGGFDSNLLVPLSEAQFERYGDAAETITAQIAPRLTELSGCEAPWSRACAETFLRDFATRAYRRPITEAELERLLTLVDLGAEDADVDHGVTLALRAILQSPHLLYVVEASDAPDAPGVAVTLEPYELASRLSFFLWSTMPDNELFRAAEASELSDVGAIEMQARRMLADPRARDTINEFHEQWLAIDEIGSLEKDAAVFPEFDPALRGQMRAETRHFVNYVFEHDDARLETLLTASYSFLDGPLYALYGVSPEDAGSEIFMGWPRVELPAGTRSGLLTQASFLAVHAHPEQTTPVFRGVVIRERFLCQSLPPPPPTVDDNPPGLDPTLSTRERFARHREDPGCATCHQLMDPIGLGFESYDAIGRYRTTEAGQPIDDSGELIAAGDADGEFQGALELGERLAASTEVQQCVATNWLRFALGRMESEADACSRKAMIEGFAASGHDIGELLVSITTTDAFRHRATAAE